MRKTYALPGPAGQWVPASLREVENAKLLIGQPIPADAVAVQNAGMRRETGQNSSGRVALRPIEDIRQDSPVGFIPQIGLPRLRAGDDHAIKLVLPEFVEAVVEAIEMTLAAISSRNSGQRVELQVNG